VTILLIVIALLLWQPGQHEYARLPGSLVHTCRIRTDAHASPAVAGCSLQTSDQSDHASNLTFPSCSDKPGQHDFDLLRKLVLPDGRLLRAQLPGRPTRDSLFNDPARDGVRYAARPHLCIYNRRCRYFRLQVFLVSRPTLKSFSYRSRIKPRELSGADDGRSLSFGRGCILQIEACGTLKARVS
jgi:hypothetical protein